MLSRGESAIVSLNGLKWSVFFPLFQSALKKYNFWQCPRTGKHDYDEMIEEVDPEIETETFHVPNSPDEEAADMVYNFKKVNKSFSRR